MYNELSTINEKISTCNNYQVEPVPSKLHYNYKHSVKNSHTTRLTLSLFTWESSIDFTGKSHGIKFSM